jgi:hypothetical protein
MISVEIAGSSKDNGDSRCEVFKPSSENRKGPVGLNAYVSERIKRTYRPIPLLNAEFGFEQAQDASFGGTPVLIHNGIDTVAWTGSNVTGTKVTFNDTGRPLSGTNSVLVAAPNLNDQWQFDQGSDITITSYVAITGFINIDKNWGVGDEVNICAFDTGTGLMVGNTVLISTYINRFQFDEWQNFSIPFEDLGLSSGTFDVIRMELTSKSGPAPTFYLDDMNVQETSGLAEFEFRPLAGEIFHMDSFVHHVVNNVTEAVMKEPTTYYGEAALTNGVLITVQTEGNIVLGLSILKLSDMTIGPHSRALEVFGNTSSVGKLVTDHPTILDGSKGDFFKYTISDDLSGLTSQTVLLFGWFEGDHA